MFELRPGAIWAPLLVVIAITLVAGCSRNHYRVRADEDAYFALHQKSDCTPWAPPRDFSVYPDWQSRLYDPSPVNDPCLPMPAPQLYAYQLPELREHDSARFDPNRPKRLPEAELIPLPDTGSQPDPLPEPSESSQVQPASHQEPMLRRLAAAEPVAQPPEIGETPDQPGAQVAELGDDVDDEVEELSGLRRVPIPESYWDSIPTDCRRRMFEFQSVLEEYQATYGTEPPADQMDDSPRLALEDIIALTILNSREYQAAKESLYRVALALMLSRFDYELKPTAGGNRTATNYTHNQSDGISVDRWTIGPTTFAVDKMLYTGGDVLARFANEVVLTFNGPRGFAADVSSDLFFEFFQTIFQWDGQLEGLTQAERDLVYAARDFARFRKELFVQQASRYYNLILDFRRVEIESQNYFTLVREFDQRAVEYRGGFTSRIDLDQIEQQVINGRRSLLNTCTSLDNSIDDLKIRIGLPTEQLINLDLSELDMLTSRDELAVNANLISRVRDRLTTEMQTEAPARATLLSAGGVLLERMLESNRLRTRLDEQPPDAGPLEELQLRIQIAATSLDVEEAQLELANELEESPTMTTVLQRRADLVGELLRQINLQIQLYSKIADETTQVDEERRQLKEFEDKATLLGDRFEQLVTEEQLAMIQQLVVDVEELQHDLESKAKTLDDAVGRDIRATTPEQQLQETVSQVKQLLAVSNDYMLSSEDGLVPVRIEMDDAMMTALVQRFDLINERGALADDWRQIKLAADDLKSILNLSASQSLSNRRRLDDDPSNFSLDDSTTSVRATLDLPFNRRIQRNRFRLALFDYQAALRRVSLLEDNIKLSVRRELRTLALAREQYTNQVASTALAFERVVSTELELRIGSATSRDFLESQNAYADALNGVASVHIGYIVGRLQLFLDLESLTVGDDGFWDELYDDQYQPEPRFQLPGYALPGYGELHPRLRYSPKMRRMLCVPTGTSMIHHAPSSPDDTKAKAPAAEPATEQQ